MLQHLRPPLLTRVANGSRAALILLDLSAAFDTVHHALLKSLHSLGFRNSALTLLRSFLADRIQWVEMGDATSSPFSLPCAVPQGSALSPTLFNVIVTPLVKRIHSFGLTVLSYADDTQIVVSISSQAEKDANNFCRCMAAVVSWMWSNCLKLNSDKTEVLLFGKETSF